jgi:ankyrin repeat protein
MPDKYPLPDDIVREFVIASHFDLPKVKALLADHPGLLTIMYDWGEGGQEDGLGAASHVGNREIAEFFLSRDVPLTICAAAMLGRVEDVRRFIDANPLLANARGAHGITVMFHAALGGNVSLAQLLKDRGCHEGFSHALHGAIIYGHTAMVEWLLKSGVQDVNVADYQQKTPLARAIEHGHTVIADLLRQHGGKEEA